MDKVLAIVGPTGVGKTKCSIALAKLFNGEIISADSMQVYRHMDIGTAKVTEEEKAGVPHYLVDVQDYSEPNLSRTMSPGHSNDSSKRKTTDYLWRDWLVFKSGFIRLCV